MADSAPIPSGILQRLLEFLRAGRTGQFALNIYEGEIKNVEVKERISTSEIHNK